MLDSFDKVKIEKNVKVLGWVIVAFALLGLFSSIISLTQSLVLKDFVESNQNLNVPVGDPNIAIIFDVVRFVLAFSILFAAFNVSKFQERGRTLLIKLLTFAICVFWTEPITRLLSVELSIFSVFILFSLIWSLLLSVLAFLAIQFLRKEKVQEIFLNVAT